MNQNQVKNLQYDLNTKVLRKNKGKIYQYLYDQGVSKREAEVVFLVICGNTNKEAANIMCVAEKTVKFHLTNIFKRLNVKRRTSLLLILPPELLKEVQEDPEVQEVKVKNETLTLPEGLNGG